MFPQSMGIVAIRSMLEFYKQAASGVNDGQCVILDAAVGACVISAEMAVGLAKELGIVWE